MPNLSCWEVITVCFSKLSAVLCLVTQLWLPATPWTAAPQAPLSIGESPGKNTGVGCHALLQGIFLTQGLNTSLLHCRWILYRPSHLAETLTCHFSQSCCLQFSQTLPWGPQRGGEGRGARSRLSHCCPVPSGGCSALRGTENPVQ